MSEIKQNQNHESCISLVPIFNHLDQDSMAKISEKLSQKTFQSGEYLFQAAEKKDTLFIVHKGKVRLFQVSESGKEQLIRILGPGDFVGEQRLFNPGQAQNNFAQAMTKTEICLIHQKDFEEVLKEHPQISLEILAEMAKRLSQSENQTTSITTTSATNRLIFHLVELIEDPNNPTPIVTLSMSKKDIASYLGTTPETISRKFKELEDAGLIKQLSNQKIKILDVDELLLYE